MIWWNDVKVEQWEHSIANIGSIEVAVAGPSVGLDLVLFYIRSSNQHPSLAVGRILTCSKNTFLIMPRLSSHFSG